jgi:hypothetical protein
MPENIVKPTGVTKASKNTAGGAPLRSEPVLATVKNNVDPVRQGRIQVFIDDLNGPDPDDSKSWITVGYMSPFYGRTYGSAPQTGYGDYGTNPISYGQWHSPPDIGTKVICIFVNGDPNYGYYIGSVPDPEALTMVPAIGASDRKVILNQGEATALAGATQLPVTNLNINNTGEETNNNYLEAPKPVHSYVAAALAQQGLIRDNVRGPITSSSQRETPSRVGWGVSTPGRPIYDGGFTDQNIVRAAETGQATGTKVVSRRPGHSIVMDDGDIEGKDQLIRLRTALGHQILMSDDGQCLFIIHANGQSYIELGQEGTIDMFSTNSVNIRTQGDLNLHADQDVNINAMRNINMRSKNNVAINSDKATQLRVGSDFNQYTLGNYTSKVKGSMSFLAGGSGSFASTGLMHVSGLLVMLNTGFTSLTPLPVKALPFINQTDTLFDKDKGFAPAPTSVKTIVSRMPAHMPWPMAGKGVDVKVNLDADAQLPSDPSQSVLDANSIVPGLPDNAIDVATAATVPDLESAGGVLDNADTSSLVSAAASQAGAVANDVVTNGTGLVNGLPAVGQLAQTATQMVTGGALKPGSQTLINGLVQQGQSVVGSMTNNLFTGNNGMNSVQSFVNSTQAQVSSYVQNITQSQTQLTNAGVINGNESATTVGGTILSGVQNGVAPTASFIKNATGSTAAIAGTATNLLSSGGGIAQSISSGNFATNLIATATSGVGGLVAALGNSFSSALGVSGSAFNSIVNSYQSFTPNVPQDLNAIASQNNTNAYTGAITDPTASATNSLINLAQAQSGLQGIPGGLSTISATINNPVGALANATGLSGYVNSIQNIGNLGNKLANVNLPGVGNLGNAVPGLNSLGNAIPNLGNVQLPVVGDIANSIPGLSDLTSSITNLGSSVMNDISSSVTNEAGSVADSLGLGSSDIASAVGDIPGAGAISDALGSAVPADVLGPVMSLFGSSADNSGPVTKMPVVATNTTNRQEFTNYINKILDNPKIPTPDYVPATSVATYFGQEYNTDLQNQATLDGLKSTLDSASVALTQASNAYQQALNNLPDGDPGIQSALDAFNTAQASYDQANNALQNFA